MLNLIIDRRGCQRVRALIAGSMVLALTGVGYSGLPAAVQLAAGLLIIASGLWELRCGSSDSGHFVTRFSVTADGQFLVNTGREPGMPLPMDLFQSWTLPGLAIGLTLKDTSGRPVTAILFRDRVPRDTWRRLLVRLRHVPR